VSPGCASAGAAANSISAMMAMRAMRDNGETAVIVARKHSSARQPREARRGQAAGAATDNPSAPASPPPLAGEGQGGGMQQGSRVQAHPLPTPPPQAGEGAHRACGKGAPSVRREHTEIAAM